VKPYNFFKELIYVFCLSIILFFGNHDISSQISSSLEMTNLRQESVGHKRWVLPFQSFLLISIRHETNSWPHVYLDPKLLLLRLINYWFCYTFYSCIRYSSHYLYLF